MAEKSHGAEALLEGMADELAALVRTHFDALKDTPVAADPAAVEKVMKVVTAVGRANLMVRAVLAAEDKLAADKAQRLNQMETMKMDDITPDELEQRADELRARIDRIMATLESKQRRAEMARNAVGGTGPVDGQEPEAPPAYRADWAETGSAEALLEAAQRHLTPIPIDDYRPGDVLLFRMSAEACVKHAAIVCAREAHEPQARIIHAYWGRACVESWLGPWWRRRLAFAFSFPGVID